MSLYSDHFAGPDAPKPVYDLTAYLAKQFDPFNLNLFWKTMRRIFIEKQQVGINIVAKNKEIYAGQRGLLFILDIACSHLGIDQRVICYSQNGGKYAYNAGWDDEEDIPPNIEMVELETHLELRPSAMMATQHFATMAFQWADELITELTQQKLLC